MPLNIRNNQRDLHAIPAGKRTIQAQREEILYRDDIKTSFTYILVGTLATLAVVGVGYSFVKQLRKE